MMNSTDSKPIKTIYLILLAVMIGFLSFAGSQLFKKLIDLVHQIAFYHAGLATDHVYLHTNPFTLKFVVIIIPVLGGLVVTYITKHFAKEARGHGVPEALYAIHYKQGIISPIVALVKVLASALTIGTGGSAGREGPIIQIGASIGSTIGQIIAMPSEQRVVLLAAGAGAGIAATFNAPLTGLAFAMELILVTVNVGTVSIVAIAVVTSTFMSYSIYGRVPDFNVPVTMLNASFWQYFMVIILSLPLAMMAGLISVLFIKVMHKIEIVFADTFQNEYVRHALAMSMVGVMLYLLIKYSGHYYIEGVGYATVNDIFQSILTNPWLLLLLCLSKLLATCLTLGTGGSGGIFSPSVFMGATLGCAYGLIISFLFPGFALNPIVFAIVGIAGVVSSATGLIFTAIVLTIETTRAYAAILPVMISAALACLVRAKLSYNNIFTLGLQNLHKKKLLSSP